MKTIKIQDPIKGHMVLLCKGHYHVPTVSFIEAARKIWAIRCGYDYDPQDTTCDVHIANELYEIIRIIAPHKMENLHREIHTDIMGKFGYRHLNPRETLIYIYRSIICDVQIKEQKGERYYKLIELPKPQKRLFKRIIKGNGRFSDYYLIKPENKYQEQ